MSRELPMYEGARREAAQVQVVDSVRLPRVQGMGEVFDRAVDAGLRAAHSYGKLHDFGVRQRVEHELRMNQDEMDEEFQRGMEARWGAEGSFYNADGSRNEDALAAFKEKWRERNEGIGRRYLLRESALEDAGDMMAVNDAMSRRVDAATLEGEFSNRRRVFNDNFELALKQDDYEGASAAVRGAVEAGQITEAKGRSMLLDIGRRRLRGGGGGYGSGRSVNVGGEEFSGLSAALAMEEARGRARGVAVPQHGRYAESGAERGGGSEGEGVVSAAPAEDFSAMGQEVITDVRDVSGVLTMMPQSEFDGVSDIFSDDVRVLTMTGGQGETLVSCAAYAPECVQRVAAVGNARGGVDAEQARMMVARIALDRVADNPEVTDAQVVDVFKDAGIFEAMGDGDAAVGKERCRAIVGECLNRGRGDSKKLGMAAIEPMIKAHLNSPEFAASREWGRVSALNPSLAKGDEWDKSDLDDAGRKRWFALYDVYKKYRSEFKPDAVGELAKEEFEANAQAFYEWYKKDKMPGLKKADLEAASDWYKLQVTSRLQEKVYESGGDAAYSGYSGYGADVQVARDVLRTPPPERLGADELMEVSRRNQAMDEARSMKFRQRARESYEQLKGMKQDFALSSEKAKKEKEQKAKTAEQQAEKAAARKLYVARSTPREDVWKWDGKNAADGAAPGCLIPEAEYQRLHDELGFDGSQLVYVQVNGAKVLVTGVSKSGKIELNAPAVAKIQKKPNRKKGERWKTDGRIEYSYYFKSTEAK